MLKLIMNEPFSGVLLPTITLTMRKYDRMSGVV